MADVSVQDAVREKYGEIARTVGKSSCCDTACGCGDAITTSLYSDDEKAGLPEEAVAVSLGCGGELPAGQSGGAMRVPFGR